jgi:CBS domain-containing protein
VAELTERAVSARVPSLARETLRVIDRRDPLTVFEGTSLGQCLLLVEGSGVGDSVLVTTPDGVLRGVLTERDIFKVIVGGEVDLAASVETLMNRTPRTLHLEQTVHEAIALFADGRFRNVPLVDDDGRVVGIVRQQDLLRYLAEAFPEELLNLPPRPHQRMKETEGA